MTMPLIQHLMLDIETLGTGKDALILSVGVRFFTNAGLGESHYWNVSPGTCGGVIDVGTVMWWFDQSDIARNRLKDHRKTWDTVGRDLLVVLDAADYIWGNGVDFDNVIVSNALTRNGFKSWHYKKNMCYRTIRNAAKACGFKELAFTGERHDALADATHQANQLLEWDKITGMLEGMQAGRNS